MGTILSSLRDALKGIKAIVTLVLTISADFSAVLKRASADPGLPNPKPTEPYWLNEPPFPELVDARSPELSETADIAIIGSGIAGAAIARSYLHERRRRKLANHGKVVVFEARQLCSGATARNGGHIKATPYELFARYSQRWPKERAAAVTRFQLRHLECLTHLCAAEGIEAAETREVETADLYLDEDSFQKATKDTEEMEKWLPDVKVTIWRDHEAREKFGVNDGVIGALSYRSGAIWPYRFVVSIWKCLLNEFSGTLSIETTTPVESISVTNNGPDGFPYAIQTPRGITHARHVVHATNGFASHLIPRLRGKMTGARAHMSAQRPGQRFPNFDGKRSWSVVYHGGAFDYVTQRPSNGGAPGDLMLGGGFSRSSKQGLDQVGVYDDGATLDALSVAHLMGVFPAIFTPNWGQGAELKQAWSGILGMTGDMLPFVGRLDTKITGRHVGKRSSEKNSDEPGEWIAAGFCGEGMIWAWLCGTAVGLMMAGSQDEELPEAPGRPGGRLADWFPPELYVTNDRVRKANVANLADQL